MLIQISFGTPGPDVSVFEAVALSSCHCNTHLCLGTATDGCKGQEEGSSSVASC